MATSLDQTLLAASRRRFLAVSAAAGVGGTMFPGVLLALASQTQAQSAELAHGSEALPKITLEMIDQAAGIAGLHFTEEQRKVMLDGVNDQRESVARVRKIAVPNAIVPSLVQDAVLPGTVLDRVKHSPKLGPAPRVAEISASNEEQVAFATVRQLSGLLRTKKITSVDLTKLYLARLNRFAPKLHFLITATEERALKQAAQADHELASGKARGPLHGVPWGAKDLLAVAGYPTTWGAGGFEKQQFDYDAEVVKRLDAAGAVLIAKLSMGALAQGDLWFGGRTRNPWNTRQGSSGSSAGSASAVSAGCVGFAIGTETLGSISSPSTRCGVTGIRPSFGLVPRTGAMALSWSMDKIGPIARSVEDAALVLAAIYGPDGHDPSVHDAAFNPDFTINVTKLRVAYFKPAFDKPTLQEIKPPSQTLSGKELDAYNARVARNKNGYQHAVYDMQFNTRALDTLRGMGIPLEPIELPQMPFGALTPMLEAEAAAAFDELTRTGRDGLLNGQSPNDWPNTFRIARMYSAVDYINASRVRRMAMEAMRDLFAKYDVVVTPSGGTQLTATNLCGQPAVIVPNGLRGSDAPAPMNDTDGAPNNAEGPGTPVSITFLAPLYGEAKACALAHAYQVKTGFHLQHPNVQV